MIGQLRVVTATGGMSVFSDRGLETVRAWSMALALDQGDFLTVVGIRVESTGLPTMWDYLFICKFGLCFIHDDILHNQTREIDTSERL